MSDDELSHRIKQAVEAHVEDVKSENATNKTWKSVALIAYRIGLVLAILKGGEYAWNATVQINEIAKLPKEIAKDRAMFATHDEVLQLKAESTAVISNHESNLKKVDAKVSDGVARIGNVEDAVNKLDGKVSVLIETIKSKS